MMRLTRLFPPMLPPPDYSHLVLVEPPSRRRVLICFSGATHFERELLAGILLFNQEGEFWRIEYSEPQYCLGKIKDFKPDGVLWIGSVGPILTELNSLSLPMVQMIPSRFSHLSTICIDDDDLGLMAADYLFSLSPSSFLYWGEKELGGLRETSFMARLKELGVTESQCSALSKANRETFMAVVSQKSLPLAIHCEHDILGKQAIDWLMDEGFAVPQKVIVLGTGDDPIYCNACEPSLSSIVLRYSQGGYDGAKQLQELMNNEEAEGRLKFITPKNIHERGSCSPFKSVDPRLQRAMQFYLENMELGQNVEEVCRFSELSYRSFHRLFKDSIGLSPKSWMEMEQFKRAQNLLKNSREKLSVVAQKCGYSDDKSLIRSFRRLGRSTPSHYRKTETKS